MFWREQDSQLPASPNLRVLSALRAGFAALTASASTPVRSQSPFAAPALNGLSNSSSVRSLIRPPTCMPDIDSCRLICKTGCQCMHAPLLEQQ